MKNLLLIALSACTLSLLSVHRGQAQTSCDDFYLEIIDGEPGHGYVGEQERFTIGQHLGDFVAPEYSVVSLPPGFDVFEYTPGDYVLELYGSPTHTGTYDFVIAGAHGGCMDTLVFTQTYMCFPESLFSYHPIEPMPEDINPATTDVYYEQTFLAIELGYEVSTYTYEISAGTIPPGLTFEQTHGYRAALTGTPSTPGAYSFTIRLSLGECVAAEVEYTLEVGPPVVCTDMTIEPDYAYGYEWWVGDTVTYNYDVTGGGVPPYTFHGIDLPEGATLDAETGLLKFRAERSWPGYTYQYAIVAVDANGCSDTLNTGTAARCISEALSDTVQGKVGQHFEMAVPHSPLNYEPYSDYVLYEHEEARLPLGLSLSPEGIISGTPQESGHFFVAVTYTGLGPCPGETLLYIFIAPPDKPVKTILVYPLCAESDSVRNWRIVNPNDFYVDIDWHVGYYNPWVMDFIEIARTGSLAAMPGETFFETPALTGPNTIHVSWIDEHGNTKLHIKGANNDLCAPPECIVASSVDFYIQRYQKGGGRPSLEKSDPDAALGAPDANDAPGSKAFSLGFYGFITLKLSADLYDHPGHDLVVHEASYGDPSFYEYPERAEVYVSKDRTGWISLGLTGSPADCQAGLDAAFDLAGKTDWCRYVRIVDRSDPAAPALDQATCTPLSYAAFNDAADGFDLDAVTCVNCHELSQQAAARQGGRTPEVIHTGGSHHFLYPNPVHNWLTVDFSQEEEFGMPEDGRVEIDIHDITGTAVYTRPHFLEADWTTKCRVDNLRAGMFIARVRTGGVTRIYKFIKK